MALVASGLLLAGCSGAEVILKIPVSTGCKEVPLKECDELTDGLMLYVEGKQEEAKPRVAKAVSANSPADLRRFVGFLQSLRGLTGAEEYLKPVFEVADFINYQAAQAEAAQHAAPPGPGLAPSGPPLTPMVAAPVQSTVVPAAAVAPIAPAGPSRMVTADTDPKQIDGGAIAPLSSPGRGPCGPLLGSSGTTCARAVDGPFVVTDVHMSGECDASIFVAATSPNGLGTSARWAVTGSTRSVSGSRLMVRKDETLIIGAPDNKKADQRCVVTWAGFRPYAD